MTEPPERIVHILGTLEQAGLQRRVLALIRQLPQFEHTVIYNPSARDAMRAEYAATCEVLPLAFVRGSLREGLRYLPRLTAALRLVQPTVVLAHLFGNHALVALAATRARVPATYGVSANDPVHYAGSVWKPLVLAHLARPCCRGEIAVSHAVANVLTQRLRLPPSRVHVIANGCAVEEIAARAEAGRRTRDRALPGHRLLMVAWIARAKDHDAAIRALGILRSRGIDAHLDIAGGVYRRERQTALEQLAISLGVSGAVRFLGARDDVPELMGASDLVVHATHSEGFGTVLLEALASRTPVVATDIPACREVLDGGACGLLAPARDPVALADAIQAVLSDAALRHRLVEAGFRRVSERYHVRHMAGGYAALIQRARTRPGRA